MRPERPGCILCNECYARDPRLKSPARAKKTPSASTTKPDENPMTNKKPQNPHYQIKATRRNHKEKNIIKMLKKKKKKLIIKRRILQQISWQGIQNQHKPKFLFFFFFSPSLSLSFPSLATLIGVARLIILMSSLSHESPSFADF